jgi:hypothetical protein
MTPELHPFADAADEAEWNAQQAALSDASIADEARVSDYRRVIRALETLPSYELPNDFARKMADAVQNQERSLDAFERIALIALSVVFLTTLVILGAAAMRDSQAVAPTAGMWLCALGACILVVIGTERMSAFRRS